MKLILNQQPDMPDIEVEVRYTNVSDKLQNLIAYIEKGEHYIPCTDDDTGSKHRVPISDILYIETIDRKTFIYTASAVYRSGAGLHQLLDKLEPFGFVQANKSCIVNIEALDSLKMQLNRKAEVTLLSGDRISVSRTFIPDIRNAYDRDRGSLL